jgi:hypothetical protein
MLAALVNLTIQTAPIITQEKDFILKNAILNREGPLQSVQFVIYLFYKMLQNNHIFVLFTGAGAEPVGPG